MENSKIDINQALEMISKGMSKAEVADFYGCSRQYIYNLCRVRGLPTGKSHAPNDPSKNPMRVKAAALVTAAIKRGVLERLPCEICGAYGKDNNGVSIVHAHHDDYRKPLHVRWLCRTHHMEWHQHNLAKD